jgi:hypothetical protein
MKRLVNDLNAPRYKVKGKFSIVNKELFKLYRQKFPESPIDNWKDFKQFLLYYLENLSKDMAVTRQGYEMPKLGFVVIGSCEKPKDRKIDHANSNIHSTELVSNNVETDGRIAKIFFTNYPRKYRAEYKELWMFNPHRDFARYASAKFKENPDGYLKIAKFEKISWRFYRKHLINLKNYG